jgi:hypothetical protein
VHEFSFVERAMPSARVARTSARTTIGTRTFGRTSGGHSAAIGPEGTHPARSSVPRLGDFEPTKSRMNYRYQNEGLAPGCQEAGGPSSGIWGAPVAFCTEQQ